MSIEEVEKAFDVWASQSPESHHALDDGRFYDFVEKASQCDESIDSDWLIDRLETKTHRMSVKQVDDYAKRLDVIQAYFQNRKILQR